MDYEKEYKSLVAKVKKAHQFAQTDSTKSVLEDILPQLRESEDERARKAALEGIEYLERNLGWDAIGDTDILDVKEYLEKQKEHNGEDEECTDFTIYHPLKNGKGKYECIPYSFHGSLTSFSEDKDLIDFLRTCFYTEEECNEWIEQREEQKPAEWNDTDMKEARDNLISVCRDWERGKKTTLLPIVAVRARYFLEHLTEPKEWSEDIIQKSVEEVGLTQHQIDWFKTNVFPPPKQEWSEEDENKIESIKGLITTGRFADTNTIRTIWKLLDSLRPQPQKLEDWTEEDERLLGNVLGCITLVQTYKACGDLKDFKTEYTGEELRSFVRSLKSRPRKQPHWKPSEEQMKHLERCFSHGHTSQLPNQHILESLYNELKKLT